MRRPKHQFFVMMAGGSIALAAAISATLSADQSPAPPARAAAAGQTTAAPPPTPARGLVTTYCVSCHNERLKTANFMLDKVDADQVANSSEQWEKVVVKLRSRSMPPTSARRPDNATYDRVATWL